MRRWVALTGLLGLLAAAAPGAVTIDAKKHCEVVDWSKKAVSVTLDPGEYSANDSDAERSPGISYGRTIGRVEPSFVMAADPTAVSSRDGKPAAYFVPMPGCEFCEVMFTVHRRTTVRFFAVDSVVAGNSGYVAIDIRTDPFRDGESEGRLVKTVRVDGVKNCYEIPFKRAYKLTLKPGFYDFAVQSGNVQFEQSDAARRRQCASVMFDFNPHQVHRLDDMGGRHDDYPIGSWAASEIGYVIGLHVTQTTTIPIYFLDGSPNNNSGAVKVSVKSIAKPYYFQCSN